jgi:hypothetical protein
MADLQRAEEKATLADMVPIVRLRGEKGEELPALPRNERIELRVAEQALRNRWAFSDEERAQLKALLLRCAAIAATPRDVTAIVRCAGYLDELDRRRDRDEAEGQQQRDKNSGDLISSLLATPEGRAALLARTHAAYDALEQQRQNAGASGGVEEIGTTLPDDYRRFLLRCNGGKIDWYQFEGPIPQGESWTAIVSHVGGLREEPDLSLRFARGCYQGRDLQIPRAMLWIMSDPGGNAICLGLTGKYRGRVYFWIHDEQPDPQEWDGEVETASNIILLANSLTDFVAGIVPRDSGD